MTLAAHRVRFQRELIVKLVVSTGGRNFSVKELCGSLGDGSLAQIQIGICKRTSWCRITVGCGFDQGLGCGQQKAALIVGQLIDHWLIGQ